MGKVRCISWFEDDSGFVSAGWDGKIFTWDIMDNSKTESEFKLKGTNFSSVVKVPDKKTIYEVGTDKCLREISYEAQQDKNAPVDKAPKETVQAEERVRYEAGINFS